jgi:hypothetical protein
MFFDTLRSLFGRYAPVAAALSIFLLLSALLFSVTQVAAQEEDLRINHSHHFGGDVLYCLDGSRQQTSTFFEPGAGGGFQLLNMGGQEIWFVDAETVLAAVEAAKVSGAVELVAQGFGTYGPVELYVGIGENDTPFFTFIGYDEHGKVNSLTFQFCQSVRPGNFGDDPEPPAPAEPDIIKDPCDDLRRSRIDIC